MPSINNIENRPDESPLGFGDKVRALLGRDIFKSTPSQPNVGPLDSLFSKATAPTSYHISEVRRALADRPDVSKILSEFLDPDMDSVQSVDRISELVELCGPPKGKRGPEGERAYHVDFNLPNGAKLGLTLFPDMDDAMSFSFSARS